MSVHAYGTVRLIDEEELYTSLSDLVKMHEDEDALAHAKYVCDTILPAMLTVRQYADELEAFVADDLWPLPTYQAKTGPSCCAAATKAH